MVRRCASLLFLVPTLVLAGCTSSTSGSAPAVKSPTASGVASSSASSSLSPSSFANTSSPGSSVVAPPDPCSLLTQQDAGSVGLKYPGSPGKQFDLGKSCDFGPMVLTAIDPQFSKSVVQDGTPVNGLGDAAFYGKEFHWLRVEKGSTRFELRCFLCPTGTELDMMTTVARKVLTHI